MNKSNKSYLFWILLVIVQAVWIFNSDGFYFIDDSSHFNYNRHYLESYDQSIGTWHRMGRVLFFALPAQFGLKGVQIVSALLFLLTIYFAYKILKEKNVKYAEWIIPLIGFQPVLFNVSYTSLAELPAAFLILLAYYFFIKEKPAQAMIAASLVFIFRTEYYYVAGFFFLIFLFRKNLKVLPLFLTGPLLWYLYTTVITGNPTQFFYDLTLHSRLLKIDVGIDWHYYLYYAPKIFGFLQVLFFAAALIIIPLKKQIKEYGLLILIIFTGIFVQTMLALKGLDLTCSIGQLRYVAVVGPAFGIISAVGVSYLFSALNSKYIKGILLILFLTVMFFLGPYSTPYHNKYEIEKVSDNIVKIADDNYPDYKLISNMHQLANSLDESQTGGKRFTLLSQSNVNNTPKALIVWCSYLEGSPFVDEDVTLKEIESIPGIKLIKEYKDTVNNCYAIPVYKHKSENSEDKLLNEFIEYLIADQTTWETIYIRVFIKE